MQQLNLFDDARLTRQQAWEYTIAALRDVGSKYKHWAIAYSGGKDSTTTLTVIAHAIAEGLIDRPESITVLYADTRQEFPPLHQNAMMVLKECRHRGFNTEIVTAALDDRFWVYLLGAGVAPPNNTTMRWCTRKIKLEPFQDAIARLHDVHHESFLVITGIRQGESAMRDGVIRASCSRNDSECGQGYIHESPYKNNGVEIHKLAPILLWEPCHVWDWLSGFESNHGFPTELLAEVYGGRHATELRTRTGCNGCPLVDRDVALENLIKATKWQYLAPLAEIRGWHRKARSFENRLQKIADTKKDGTLFKNPSRVGPLTLEFRLEFLDAILNIQSRCNALRPHGAPVVDLINKEEETRIQELIFLKTFPQKWDGTEPRGNELTPQYKADGTFQPVLFGEYANL